MTEFEADLDIMREVYYELYAIADGRELESMIHPLFENEPDIAFSTCYTAIIRSGRLVEGRELFNKAVNIGNDLSREFHENGDESGYQTLDYYLDKFIEMHRQAGITVD